MERTRILAADIRHDDQRRRRRRGRGRRLRHEGGRSQILLVISDTGVADSAQEQDEHAAEQCHEYPNRRRLHASKFAPANCLFFQHGRVELFVCCWCGYVMIVERSSKEKEEMMTAQQINSSKHAPTSMQKTTREGRRRRAGSRK